MLELLIKNGSLLSPVNGYHQEVMDILLKNGRIEKIAPHIEAANAEVIDASGCLVTPGLIDIHVHCFPQCSLGIEPDVLGIKRGATTIFDAGSSGALNYETFRSEYIDQSKTKVFTLLNVSKLGLAEPHELDDLNKIDRQALKAAAAKYPDNIVGLKARASASVVGAMGFEPIRLAAEIAHEVKLPLMVHVGNYPPALKDVLNVLEAGDIVTHAYHGKKGGILNADGTIIEEALNARRRGVLFDIGHGVASFSFKTFKQAMTQSFDCDLISTDLHVENYQGPVYNLAAVLSKLLNCGESLEDVISKATSVPARHYQLKGLGELKEGFIGDLSVMKLSDCDEAVVDSIGDSLTLKQRLTLVNTISSRGDEIEVFRHDTEQ